MLECMNSFCLFEECIYECIVKTFIRQVYRVTSSRVGFSKDVDSSWNSSILEFQRHCSVSEFSFDERFSFINNYYKHAK